jgi:prepilin-type processing-associated H-X9-DG protein
LRSCCTPGNGGEIAPVIDFGCKTFVASRDYGEGNNDPTSTSYTTGYGMIYYMKLPSAGDWGRSLNRSDYSGFRYNFQGPTREGTPPVKMTAIKRKDKQWVIGDSINYLMSPALWEGGAVHPESHGIWFWYAPGTAYQRRSGHVIFDKATKGSDPARHVGKQANYLFVDGHAESLNPYAALITLYPYEVER